MEINAVQAALPDIHIKLTNDEAHELRQMMYEAKSYAQDCDEVTTSHEQFIESLEIALEMMT